MKKIGLFEVYGEGRLGLKANDLNVYTEMLSIFLLPEIRARNIRLRAVKHSRKYSSWIFFFITTSCLHD